MADINCQLTEAANAASFLSCTTAADWPLIVLTALIASATLGGVALAWRSQRDTLTRRVTFDYIASHELGPDWVALATTAVQRLTNRPSQDDWGPVATAWSKSELAGADLDHAQPIFDWLNRREFLCAMLLSGTAHQASYADWWGIPLIREWERAEPFIRAIRATKHGTPGHFRKFQDLATSDAFRQLSNWTDKDSIHATPSTMSLPA